MTPISFDYPITVAILYTTYEDDTVETAMQMKEALERQGHAVRMFEVTPKNWRKALKTPGEVVINIVEDPNWSLSKKIVGMLERLGRVQVGYGRKSLNYVFNKARLKRTMGKHSISTPNFRILDKRHKNIQVRGLEYPLIVKPAYEHASNGITQDSVVIDQDELQTRVEYILKHFGGEVVVEEYIEGRELHITLIGNGRQAVCLPYAEIDFKGEFKDNWNVYSYEAKWEEKSWEYWDSPTSCPAYVPLKTQKMIDKLLVKAFKVFGCCDVVRFDVRLDEHERPNIIDMNIFPSLKQGLEEECWRSAEALNWSYEDLIETLVAIAYKRGYGKLPDRVRERQFLLTGPRFLG